jgi:hypothetical protein
MKYDLENPPLWTKSNVEHVRYVSAELADTPKIYTFWTRFEHVLGVLLVLPCRESTNRYKIL